MEQVLINQKKNKLEKMNPDLSEIRFQTLI